MSTILERQYRRTLRWYPSSWRSQHEDAVIGTLLDVAEGENRSRPRLGEQLNLAANGMLTRIGLFLPARVRDGVATVALATGTAFATVYQAGPTTLGPSSTRESSSARSGRWGSCSHSSAGTGPLASSLAWPYLSAWRCRSSTNCRSPDGAGRHRQTSVSLTCSPR
jgi:hypothetical protein